MNMIKLATNEEIDKDYQKINEINDNLDIVLEKKSKLYNFLNISLTQLFIRMSNITIDVCKELTDAIFKDRKFKYQEKFKWWKRYTTIISDIYDVLIKEDRLIYFGLFLIFLAILFNFLDMIH